jgi:hypothetical protein
MNNISPQYIRDLLDYDPETGIFIWKHRQLRKGIERLDKAWNTRLAGKIVASFCHRNGHLYFSIHNKNCAAHRVAWAHYYGQWPDRDIDHRNGNPADNRISNLRLATDSQNLCNAKIRVNNTSGFKGVSWSKKERKWYAYITKDKKMIGIGRFHCFGKAIVARKLAAKQMHGDFVRFT